MLADSNLADATIPPSTLGAKPNEKGQRHWWDDVDTLNRVKRVHSLTEQKLSAEKIAKLLGVVVRTVHGDRARYLELAREDIKQDVKDHIARLDETIEEAWSAFHAISASSTFGIKRSDYLNIIRQAVMDKAKLDGSLNADPIQVGIQINMGPAPNELFNQGKLSDGDYESHLRVLALQSGAEIIEGEVLSPAAGEPDGASPPPSPVLRRRATSPPPRAGVAQAAPVKPLNDDPMLAEFEPDPIEDDEEDEDE